MKKSLIALAALAASGFAMAQSSVTLFGTVDTNLTYVDGKDSVSAMGNGGLSSPAIGFRGVEDLGGGLKAGFHLEAGVNTDNGDGAAGRDGGDTGTGLEFKRRSTLSLLSGWGELRLGRDLVPTYTAHSRFDPFGVLGIGAARVWSTTLGGVRRNNQIAYYSPSFGGFKVNASYAFGEKDTGGAGQREGNFYGLAALYDNGPLSLSATYFDQQRDTSGGKDRDGWGLGAAYDFKVVKLSAAYQKADQNTVPGTAAGKEKNTGYLIGLSAPVGAAGVVKFSYNHYDQKKGTAAKDKANHYSLGYVHTLSKRTAVYGAYSYLKNSNQGAVYTLANSGWTNPALDKGKIQAVQVGVRHNF